MTAIPTNDIHLLLQRYYDALTTEAEEQRMRELLAASSPDDPVAADAQIIAAMAAAAPASEGFEGRIEHAVDSWNAIEKQSLRRSRLVVLRAAAAAAVAVVLAGGATVAYNHHQHAAELAARPSHTDTYTDPRDAYAETQRALVLFSRSINRGLDRVSRTPGIKHGERQ